MALKRKGTRKAKAEAPAVTPETGEDIQPEGEVSPAPVQEPEAPAAKKAPPSPVREVETPAAAEAVSAPVRESDSPAVEATDAAPAQETKVPAADKASPAPVQESESPTPETVDAASVQEAESPVDEKADSASVWDREFPEIEEADPAPARKLEFPEVEETTPSPARVSSPRTAQPRGTPPAAQSINTDDLLKQLALKKAASEDLKNYLEVTLFPQMKYYDDKSQESKRLYDLLMLISIVLGALIPVASIFSNAGTFSKAFIATLGSTVTAINAYLSLHNYRDLWVAYRDTKETLTDLLNAYLNEAGPFKKCGRQIDRDAKLFTFCEQVRQGEHKKWGEMFANDT